MNEKIPRTPFSTPLSGSARETELRLKNIFSGPKKRPPVLFLALMFSLCVFCGNLVSCQIAGPENFNGPVPEPPDTSNAVRPGDDWQPVTLENNITYGSFYGSSEAVYEEPRFQILTELPADELPREAVELQHATRQDFWRDMLLPVAADEAADVTLYFAVDPDTMSADRMDDLIMLQELTPIGVVLRHGNLAQFLDLNWETHWRYGANPWLAVEDFDGDSEPEAAIALGWGSGTGVDAQCLYILDLDVSYPSPPYLPYSSINYGSLPLEIFTNPEGTAAQLLSGGQELEVDLSELKEFFPTTAAVGDVVRFFCDGGQLYCQLDVDFSGFATAYLARGIFPVRYEDDTYCLGPAVLLTDDLLDERSLP